jgi:glycosyltransferase involved in cell wall biosynthesis
MKILMTADTVGGVWHYALSLCREVCGRGHRVVLATMGAAMTADQRYAAHSVPGLKVVESTYRLEWMQSSGFDVAESGDWLLELAERHRTDLIHINGYAHAALPFGRPVLCVAHSDVISWHDRVRRRAPGSEWNAYRFRLERGLEAATAVIVPTRAVAEDLMRGFGCSPGRCTVIENGVDLDVFSPGKKEPTVLCAGRIWDEAKNIALLARIAGHVTWPVAAAGNRTGPDGGTYDPAGIRLLGSLDRAEMASRLASAAIFAAPARYEPFGLAIAEAAASGCALVLSDIPSLRELWGHAALYVPLDNDRAWAAVLNWLIASPVRRRRLGVAARRRAQLYSASRMGGRYLDLYAALCREPAHA